MASPSHNQDSSRRILLLDDTPEILSDVLDDTWEISLANTLTAIRRAISDTSIRVVVAPFFRGREPLTLKLAEELLFERRDIRAVAIIERGMLENERLRRSLSKLFFDFLTFPLDPDAARYAIGHAHGMALITCCNQNTDRCIKNSNNSELVGDSPVMRALRDQIARVANAQAPVMIGGESGTGKELAARTIHTLSARANAPFIAVNMAAIPENLAQTELFGHEKGAFTGADKRRIGYIESANGGTLFLDEIGDLPLQLQGNLLRFLQEGVITRVGGTEAIPVDVRIISATHVDLEKAVASGDFREDLFYRLNVLQLKMPPLRERGNDIELLAEKFFTQFCAQSRCCARGFSQQAINVMKEHPWPGNVREMINRVQRAVVMCTDNLIQPEDLGLERRTAPRRIEKLSEARSKVEKQLICTALMDTGHNLSETSRLLGISRVTLYKLLEKHQVEHPRQNT